jgi:hypothetical protein
MNSLANYLTHTLHERNMPLLAVVLALAMTMCGTNICAQSGAGSIQGTVTDSTGAVMPGATINVVQQGTNSTSSTKSNDVGFYQCRVYLQAPM